jgi:hypothetical protein
VCVCTPSVAPYVCGTSQFVSPLCGGGAVSHPRKSAYDDTRTPETSIYSNMCVCMRATGTWNCEDICGNRRSRTEAPIDTPLYISPEGGDGNRGESQKRRREKHSSTTTQWANKLRRAAHIGCHTWGTHTHTANFLMCFNTHHRASYHPSWSLFISLFFIRKAHTHTNTHNSLISYSIGMITIHF